MPRSLWSGSLSFGLVNVPVRLVSGARDLDLHFRQLREKDLTPIEVQRWCSKEEKQVPYEEIARLFEFDDGDTVVVTDDELESLEPERTRTIEIDAFVDLGDVDPIHFDHPYLLIPAGDDDGTLRAYRLLLDVMGQTDRAALGRFVMRTKEYRAIVRARDGALSLTTMLMHDEVRATKGIDSGSKGKAPKKQLDTALGLIEAMTVEWDPASYEDEYRARLLAVVDQKRKGKTITVPDQVDEPSPVPDLMAALRESLDAARGISKKDDDGARRRAGRADARGALRARAGARRARAFLDEQEGAHRGSFLTGCSTVSAVRVSGSRSVSRSKRDSAGVSRGVPAVATTGVSSVLRPTRGSSPTITRTAAVIAQARIVASFAAKMPRTSSPPSMSAMIAAAAKPSPTTIAVVLAAQCSWAPNMRTPPAPIASRFDQPLPSMPSHVSPLTVPSSGDESKLLPPKMSPVTP